MCNHGPNNEIRDITDIITRRRKVDVLAVYANNTSVSPPLFLSRKIWNLNLKDPKASFFAWSKTKLRSRYRIVMVMYKGKRVEVENLLAWLGLFLVWTWTWTHHHHGPQSTIRTQTALLNLNLNNSLILSLAWDPVKLFVRLIQAVAPGNARK